MALTPTQEAQVLQLIAQQTALLSLAGNEATITSKLAATKANLSQLTAASSIADADLMLIRQGSTDRNFIASLLKAYAQTGAVLTTGAQMIAGEKTFSDNLGLGVVPSAWGVNYKAIQMPSYAVATDTNSSYQLNNAYIDSAATRRYIASKFALNYWQDASDGAHKWQSAPSGTAGNPITFTTLMETTATGQLRTRTTGGGALMDAYACRAWVNFNGTGTVAIRANGNVTSITDNGVGDYTANFTTAMPDANYSVSISVQRTASDTNMYPSLYFGAAPTQTASSVRFQTRSGSTNSLEDVVVATVAIFR